jgi:hypothetical protein
LIICLQEHGSGTEDSNQSTRGHLHGRSGTSSNWWVDWDSGVVDWWWNIGWGGVWGGVNWGSSWWARGGGGGGAGKSPGAWAVGDGKGGWLGHGVGLSALSDDGGIWAVGDIGVDNGGGVGNGSVGVSVVSFSHDGDGGGGNSEDGGELHFCVVGFLLYKITGIIVLIGF